MNYNSLLGLLAARGMNIQDLHGVLGAEIYGIIRSHQRAPFMVFSTEVWSMIMAAIRYFIARQAWLVLQEFMSEGNAHAGIQAQLPLSYANARNEHGEFYRCAVEAGVGDMLPYVDTELESESESEPDTLRGP